MASHHILTLSVTQQDMQRFWNSLRPKIRKRMTARAARAAKMWRPASHWSGQRDSSRRPSNHGWVDLCPSQPFRSIVIILKFDLSHLGPILYDQILARLKSKSAETFSIVLPFHPLCIHSSTESSPTFRMNLLNMVGHRFCGKSDLKLFVSNELLSINFEFNFLGKKLH